MSKVLTQSGDKVQQLLNAIQSAYDSVSTGVTFSGSNITFSGTGISFTNIISGSINGNAATATQAAQDGSGNIISDTYVKKAGDTMTGTLTMKRAGTSTDALMLRGDSEGGNIDIYSGGSHTNYWEIDSYNGDLRVYTYRESDGAFRSASLSQDGVLTVPTVVGNLTGNCSGSSGSCTGNAATVSRATFGDSSNGEHNANNITSNGLWYYTSNGPSTSLGASTSDGALYSQAYSTSWVGQIAQDYRNGRLFVRGKKNGTWQSWLKVLDTGVVKDYVTEQGTSGSWYYRKWSSGKRECWMKNTFTATCGTWFSNGVYRSDTVYMGAFPSGLFTTTPIVLQTPETVGAWFWLSQNSVTSSSAGYIMIHQAYSSSATTYIVHIYAYGY